MDTNMKWYSMPVNVQIANIGSEVERALRWKDRDPKKAENFCRKAISFWEIVKSDPKNRFREEEFQTAMDELEDFFLGENLYQTTEQDLRRYYDAFLDSI